MFQFGPLTFKNGQDDRQVLRNKIPNTIFLKMDISVLLVRNVGDWLVSQSRSFRELSRVFALFCFFRAEKLCKL